MSARAEPRTPKTVLFLGRMHPIKGLDRLLVAWKHVAPHRPDWRLRLVGPSHGDHRAELEAQAAALGLSRVCFEDGLLGAEKDAALQSSDLLVLPSLSENFGLVVAEALAHWVPVIATRGAPWQGLVPEGCGWWIDHGAEAMQAALLEATALSPEERDAMGSRGRAWMVRDYSWAHVAAEMSSVYRWCLGRGEKPACVLTPRD